LLFRGFQQCTDRGNSGYAIVNFEILLFGFGLVGFSLLKEEILLKTTKKQSDFFFVRTAKNWQLGTDIQLIKAIKAQKKCKPQVKKNDS